MNKPNSYDETQAGTGDFTPVELGGHYGIIKNVLETNSKNGKPMVIVSIDFDQKDTQPAYFKDMYDNDDRNPKKWPYQATQYIVTEDNDGKCSRSFKGFCTAFEDSNGITVKWTGGEEWAKQFANKRIGVVFREVEEEYNGEVKTRRRIAWFCDYAKALDASVPKKKELQKPAPASVSSDGFMPIPDVDEVPW